MPSPANVSGVRASYTVLEATIRVTYKVVGGLVLISLAFAFAPQAGAQQQSTRSPHGPLTIPCENCHTSTSWRPIRAVPEFSHDSTRYPLRGMHEKVYCIECHLKPVFTDVGKNCADCHADIHRRQFGSNCAECHTVLGWQVSIQSIKQHTNRFPLLGMHAVVECQGCHKNAAVGQYQGLSTACVSCHMADYQKTVTPNHVAMKFSTSCDQTSCHKSFDTWLSATFDHAAFGFPLTNGHANVPCASCHINNNYSLTTALNDCGNSGCHLTTWQQTNNPVHSTAGAQFGVANCAGCHNTVSWTTGTFDHSKTAFPLMGAHTVPPRTCTDSGCHVGGNYTSLPTTCFGCHTTDYNNTTKPGFYADNPPNHVGANFSTTCTQCHNMSTWTGATFNHNTFFSLTNAHAVPPLSCVNSKCHVGGNYTSVPTACSGCHMDAYNSTVSIVGIPDHKAANYPVDCTLCHDTILWTDAVFDHNKTTFPLQGAHISVPCTSCHTGGNYTTLPMTCVPCHQAAFDSTNTPAMLAAGVPNHVTGNYPTTCLNCHTMTNWLGALFDHSKTPFGALTGKHATIACNLCHITSAPPPMDCYSCHTAAWQSTMNLGGQVPNHLATDAAAIGIVPAACGTCHTTTNWLGATMAHPFFPVNHGNANGVCLTCHVNSNVPSASYTVFQCIICHGGGVAANFHHPNVGGYAYNSVACYQCHKR